jgi:predicted enzyme related to lactoylglutathione lyase
MRNRPRPLAPYVEVESITEATKRARLLGASVLLEPREGPAGWRSVLATPAGGEIALWQTKEPQLQAPVADPLRAEDRHTWVG